jgi:hypothetical protein
MFKHWLRFKTFAFFVKMYCFHLRTYYILLFDIKVGLKRRQRENAAPRDEKRLKRIDSKEPKRLEHFGAHLAAIYFG